MAKCRPTRPNSRMVGDPEVGPVKSVHVHNPRRAPAFVRGFREPDFSGGTLEWPAVWLQLPSGRDPGAMASTPVKVPRGDYAVQQIRNSQSRPRFTRLIDSDIDFRPAVARGSQRHSSQ